MVDPHSTWISHNRRINQDSSWSRRLRLVWRGDEQETAEERIRRVDADNLRHDQAFRDLAAKHWREGRRMLRSLPLKLQTEMVEGWNSSSIPPDAAYFADFVRTRLRRSGILNVGGFSDAVFNV